MSFYRYSPASAVSEVRFRYAKQRAPVALLRAQEASDSNKLAEIRRVIDKQGWEAVPMLDHGQMVLQVTGFKDAGEMAALLASYHFVEGAPQVVAEPEDKLHRTVEDWAEHHSLKTAGWLNLVGDVGLLVSGVMKQQHHKIVAGALYTAGAGVLARYANVKTEHQVRYLLERTADTIKQQAGELPEDASLTRIADDHRKGVIQKAEDFLYRYPAETMLSAYTLGAGAMLYGGMRDGSKSLIGYGVSSLACKLGSLVIPEKHKADQPAGQGQPQADHGPLGQVVNWIQEKPLRLLGFGSIVTDTLLGISAYHEFKQHKGNKAGYLFDFITTGTYLAADLLMAVSNKHTVNADGQFSPDEQARVEAMAAEVIARQPKELQGPLVLKVSRLLGARPEMRGGEGGVSQHILTQIEQMGKNPWAQRVAASQQAAQEAPAIG